MKTILVDGVSVEVERKRIKNLYLRVKPGDSSATASVPMGLPDAAVEAFVRERLPWIKKHLTPSPSRAERSYCTGETLLLWGESLPLTVEEGGKRAKISWAGEGLHLRVPPGSDRDARKRAVDAWYAKQLITAIQEEAPGCERLVGRQASAWRVRDMTSRWGTCNTATGLIRLNLRLVCRERKYLRYVMIHELTHLLEPSHNQRFYALMDKALPPWQRLRKELKQREE